MKYLSLEWKYSLKSKELIKLLMLPIILFGGILLSDKFLTPEVSLYDNILSDTLIYEEIRTNYSVSSTLEGELEQSEELTEEQMLINEMITNLNRQLNYVFTENLTFELIDLIQSQEQLTAELAPYLSPQETENLRSVEQLEKQRINLSYFINNDIDYLEASDYFGIFELTVNTLLYGLFNFVYLYFTSKYFYRKKKHQGLVNQLPLKKSKELRQDILYTSSLYFFIPFILFLIIAFMYFSGQGIPLGSLPIILSKNGEVATSSFISMFLKHYTVNIILTLIFSFIMARVLVSLFNDYAFVSVIGYTSTLIPFLIDSSWVRYLPTSYIQTTMLALQTNDFNKNYFIYTFINIGTIFLLIVVEYFMKRIGEKKWGQLKMLF